MTTPARILHALAGAPEVDGCAPVEPCRCYMCAAPTERGAPVRRWIHDPDGWEGVGTHGRGCARDCALRVDAMTQRSELTSIHPLPRTRPKCEASGKTRYASERSAKRGRRLRSSDRLGVYLCPHCHGWHLTSARGVRR